MKLTADQFYYVYFCMLQEPAMFKPLSYSSEFVSIRQLLILSTDNASFKANTYEQVFQIYLCQWIRLATKRLYFLKVLKSYGAPKNDLKIFYCCVIRSTLELVILKECRNEFCGNLFLNMSMIVRFKNVD